MDYDTLVAQAGWTQTEQIALLRSFIRDLGHDHTLTAVLGATRDAQAQTDASREPLAG